MSTWIEAASAYMIRLYDYGKNASHATCTQCIGNVVRVLGLETRELFNAFDEDGNGVLALSEITGVLKSAGINADERDVANLMNVYDADGDGKISYIEFQRVLRDQIQARAENLIALFKLYDVDKDHMISIHECITLFEDVGVEEETLKEYLDEYFPAKNSKIGFKAFCKIFSQFV